MGGVVGFSDDGFIINCYHEGLVKGNNDIGGVAGYSFGNVENCYNIGDVYGTGNVGGVLGDNYSSIKNCYNIGAVHGDNIVGGIIGYNYLAGVVENIYHIGTISASTWMAGGIVGVNDEGVVKNTYHIGEVSCSNYGGGVVGFNYGSVENSYFLLGNAEDNGLGTAINEEQFAQDTTFTEWDFNTIWHMDKDLGRPVLTSIPEKNNSVEYGIKSVSYDKTQSGYDVTTVLTKPAENYVLIVALYDENGCLLSVGSAYTDSKTQYVLNIPSEKAGKYIKVFLWDSMSKMASICQNGEINIE